MARVSVGTKWIVGLCLLLMGCSDGETSGPPGAGDGGGGSASTPCPAGELPHSAGGCCPAGSSVGPDGSCLPAGIPPEACAEGFVPTDQGGCEAVLPAAPCPAGLMALPGETECREIMPCGSGPWGEIPVDATTLYVDQSYDQGAGPSDGTEARPYTLVGDAVDAAPTGALIAVAPGSYVEDVRIFNKAVRLWGKCPAEVELLGTGSGIATVIIIGGASGTELAGLAIAGPSAGIAVTNAVDVELHELWIHDNSVMGISVEDSMGPASVTLSSSLIEQNESVGVSVHGVDAALEAVVVRSNRPLASDQTLGRGIVIGDDADSGRRANLSLRDSLIDQNHECGVQVGGSDAHIDAVVIRDTAPQASDQTAGAGLRIQSGEHAGNRSNAVVQATVIERNHDLGVHVSGSDATFDAVVIRDTQPMASDQTFGRGLGIQDSLTGDRAQVLLRASLIEQNHEFGIMVAGSDVEIDAVAIRDTAPMASDQDFGRGITIQYGTLRDIRSSVVLRSSRIEQSYQAAVVVLDSDVLLHGVSVADTKAGPVGGRFGDGIAVWSQVVEATAELSGCHIGDSVRAGLSIFGATTSLHATHLSCNQVQLAAEIFEGHSATFIDRGLNRCSCGDDEAACVALSVGLEPPSAPAQ